MPLGNTESLDVFARETRALDEARAVLSGDRASAEQALLQLPLSRSDGALIRMTLGLDRTDTPAMMLGKAAVALVEFEDAAAGLGIGRSLEEFWTGPGQADERYRPLARVELGSLLVLQAGAMIRLGQVDRAVRLVDAYPGLHDRKQYLRIRAAEGLARAQRFEEARAMLPPDRPQGDIAEQSGWDVVHNLLAVVDPGTDDPDDFETAGGTIEERWETAIDQISHAIEHAGRQAGMPNVLVSLMVARLTDERSKTPASESELVVRLNGLSEAMRGALGR